MSLEALIADLLNESPDSIDSESSPKTVQSWDSLKHLEIVMAIENAYSVQFGFSDVSGLGSVGGIRKALESKGVSV